MDSVKLQKYFSDCGIMSRRAAEEIIQKGLVRVNGQIATLGDRILPGTDLVEYKGSPVVPTAEGKRYLLLYKPRGYVTTMSDEKGRPAAVSLLSSVRERVYPIGRLDMDSEGLLLFTNDGDLTYALTHPRHEIPKIYRVTVKGELSAQTLRALSSSMVIDGYTILPVKTTLISESSERGEATLEMTLYEGRNRQIRKMCAAVGLSVRSLCRIAIGDLRIGRLRPGQWRDLSLKEIEALKKTSSAAESGQYERKQSRPC